MAKQWKPKRIRSEDERGSGSSGYIQLDEGEKFLGYALFVGDPAEDEVGYYEYQEHWVTGAKSRSVPCAGEDCPICEGGEKPRDRAKTLWLVVKDEKGNTLDPPELRIFNFNSILIKQITEMRSEDETVMGQQFRVTRMDDRGNYVLQPKTGKTLKKKEINELLKSKDAPDFDALVTSQLRKAMEGIITSREMEDDDDDDDKPAKKKKDKDKKTKAKAKPEPDDDDDDDDDKTDDEWPDEGLDEEAVEVAKVDKGGEFIEVTHDDYDGKIKVYTNPEIEFDLTDLSKGDEVTVSTGAKDDDGDYVLTEEPEPASGAKDDDDDDDEPTAQGGDDPDPDENGLPDEIEDEKFVITEIDSTESTMEIESSDLELQFTLYFLAKGPASEVDFDDYEVGNTITVSAEKDSMGDMVATVVPEVVKEKKSKSKPAKEKKAAKGGKAKDTKKSKPAKKKAKGK